MQQNNNEIVLERFNARRRLVHWIHAAAFFVLLGTGLTYVTPGLTFLAEGGIPGTLHRIFAVVFLAVPLIYLVIDPKGFKEFVRDSLNFEKSDIGFHLRMPFYILGKTQGIPPQGKLNAGHKLHHIFMGILFVTLGVSGLVKWLGVGHMGPAMLNLMGTVHIISVFVITIMTLGHVYFTVVYWALPSMIHGKVTESYVKLEHRKWWDEELAPKVKGSSGSSQSG